MAENGMDDGNNDESTSNSCYKSDSDGKFKRVVEEMGKKDNFQDDDKSPEVNMHANTNLIDAGMENEDLHGEMVTTTGELDALVANNENARLLDENKKVFNSISNVTLEDGDLRKQLEKIKIALDAEEQFDRKRDLCHCDTHVKEAAAIWEIGKQLGLAATNDETEILERIVDMEARDFGI
ncbi:hypothetical protein CCACVL1_30085 [Corchorus capsularis]|uniref:Uncharacterized protein n=1 Tax=Corchorus capsularis TaxID=210143 RepID=A0A1R3FYS8_COCAP|nr:hypothetical protein CCACVL1_30085 [Corchorus capsularis]